MATRYIIVRRDHECPGDDESVKAVRGIGFSSCNNSDPDRLLFPTAESADALAQSFHGFGVEPVELDEDEAALNDMLESPSYE